VGKISEVEALKAVDDVLSGLEEMEARDRVLRWAWEKYSTKTKPSTDIGSEDGVVQNVTKTKASKKKKPSVKNKSKSKGKIKTTLTIVKDLDLRPKGKKSFADFSDEKKPTSQYEQCAVAVYYLRQELGLTAVSTNHVYTCFKLMKWRIPSDLPNRLRYAASQFGWFDTSNAQDIKITPMGENLVEHDLPSKSKDSKKS
jgi:hypothetical protein